MKLVRGLRAYRGVLLPLCSAVLYLVAFYVPGAWFLIFVALVPLLLSLTSARSMWSALRRCFIFGLLISGGTTFWILESIPITSSGFEMFVDAVKILSFLLVVLTLSICIACWGPLIRAGKPSSIVGGGVLSALWVFLEYMRMHAFNVLTYEAQTGNPAFFSVGFIGYPLADSESFLQLASIGGVFLMGFVVVFVNFLVYQSVFRAQAKKPWRLLMAGIVVTILLLIALPLASVREALEGTNQDILSVGIISLHEPTMEIETLEDIVQELSEEGAKLIVLPEGSRFFLRTDEDFTANPGVTIIDSRDLTVSGHRRDVFSAFAGTPGEEKEEFVRSKLVLSPQGEYHVALFTTLASLFGFENALENSVNIPQYSAGGIGNAVAFSDGVRASVLFCIEILAPGFGKQLVTEQKSDMIVTLVSQRRFVYSYTLRKDTERFLKVQAVEAQVPLVVSSNHAPAYVYDKYGKILKILGTNRASEHEVVPVAIREE